MFRIIIIIQILIWYKKLQSDNFKKTGCYNIRCAGFVQTNKEIFIGRAIGTISQYGGLLCVLAFSISQVIIIVCIFHYHKKIELHLTKIGLIYFDFWNTLF